MTVELYDLIANYRDWLKYFTRNDYESHFEEYRAAGEPVVSALADPVAAAAELLEKLERDWALNKLRYKIRRARDIDKMVICMFFNPMAMSLPSPKGKEVADELCRLYGERYPKERYQIGTFELYMDGFKPRFLGFKLG